MQANLQHVGLDTEPCEAHAVAWCLATVRGEKIRVWTCFKDLRFSNAAFSMYKTVKEVTKSDREAWREGFSTVCIQGVCLGFWLVEHLQPASDVSFQIGIAISISTGVPKLRIRLLLRVRCTVYEWVWRWLKGQFTPKSKLYILFHTCSAFYPWGLFLCESHSFVILAVETVCLLLNINETRPQLACAQSTNKCIWKTKFWILEIAIYLSRNHGPDA